MDFSKETMAPPKRVCGNRVRTCPNSLLVWTLWISFLCKPGQAGLRFGELMCAWGLTSQRAGLQARWVCRPWKSNCSWFPGLEVNCNYRLSIYIVIPFFLFLFFYFWGALGVEGLGDGAKNALIPTGSGPWLLWNENHVLLCSEVQYFSWSLNYLFQIIPAW